MQSWVFRHRVRLRVLYGPMPGAPLPGLVAVPAPVPGLRRAGRVERSGENVVLHPFGSGGRSR